LSGAAVGLAKATLSLLRDEWTQCLYGSTDKRASKRILLFEHGFSFCLKTLYCLSFECSSISLPIFFACSAVKGKCSVSTGTISIHDAFDFEETG
jgi:hypothetical protein